MLRNLASGSSTSGVILGRQIMPWANIDAFLHEVQDEPQLPKNWDYLWRGLRAGLDRSSTIEYYESEVRIHEGTSYFEDIPRHGML